MTKRDTYKTGEGRTNDARCYSMAHQTIQYSYDLYWMYKFEFLFIATNN